MTAPIPRDGLAHVLAGWNGQGQLLEALAAVHSDDPIERAWSGLDIRRRANRVLFAQLAPALARLPPNIRRWRDALPAETSVIRELAPVPSGRLDVVRTRARGWPPDAFVVRRRHRIAEELLARTTAWVLDQLADIAADARALEPGAVDEVEPQLAAAAGARSVAPLVDAEPEMPDRPIVAALRRAGPPWSTVSAIAERIRAAAHDLDALARRLIEPDEHLRWRLFHLAVLGEVLLGLRDTNAAVVSVHPLSASVSGPAYRAVLIDGRTVDLWFEAAGIWHTLPKGSPYREATSGVDDAGRRALGPDILVRMVSNVLVIECKYSSSGLYVATGYEQVLAYAAELAGVAAPAVDAVVVGPDGIVSHAGTTTTTVGAVSIVPASDVRPLVRRWLT